MYTIFDMIISKIQPIPEEKLQQAVEIIQNLSLDHHLLDFCVRNDCFTQEDAQILYNCMIRYEELEYDSYYEFDNDMLLQFYDAIGVTPDVFEQYAGN